MHPTTEQTIRDTIDGSNKGQLHFGQVVSQLLQAGVESYQVDYRAQRITYYLPEGSPLTLDLDVPDVAIAQRFDADAIKAAIKGSQRGEVMYPEFKRLSQLGGCVGYTVWLTGRHVSYFGRNGETHVERFPAL